MLKRNKISAQERDKIAVMLAAGLSLRNISRSLDRSVSSISDEIKRNSIKGEYQSIAANSLSLQRNRQSRKKNPLKSSKIFSYVFEKLREGWSPEQIAGRLKRLNKGKTVICHETIYRYIYRRGIPQRVSIRFRPDEINSKKTFGHWEADVVEGKKHEKGIQTLLERKTRYYQARILDNIDSEYGVKAQRDILESFPKKARKSITFDNGKENYNHLKLQRWLKLKTYFCDPNCAWQKGSNEYHNGVLRRYIPKKADLTKLTQTDLDSIIEEINNLPKKCLQYQTPVSPK